MKEAQQSLRDPRLLIVGNQGNPRQGGGMRRASAAEVSSTERLSPRLNLRRSTQVGASNVISLSVVYGKHTGQRTVTYSKDLRNLVDWVSVSRLSQKSGNMRSGGSAGVGTPTTDGAVLSSILKEWLWPSPTNWSL